MNQTAGGSLSSALPPLLHIVSSSSSSSSSSNNFPGSKTVALSLNKVKLFIMGQASSVSIRGGPMAERAKPTEEEISSKVALGAGCYWGTEKFIKKDFQKRFPGSIKVGRVGFMSPNPNAVQNPSYEMVCSGQTGHIEVLYLELNDPKAHFEELIRFFFQFHDPTTHNRQGNDTGTQYASFIFTYDESQNKIAMRVRDELQQMIDSGRIGKRILSEKKVSTKIGPANEFYEAHKEHQEYLQKNPMGYCNHFLRMKDWPKDAYITPK